MNNFFESYKGSFLAALLLFIAGIGNNHGAIWFCIGVVFVIDGIIKLTENN